MLLDTHAHLWKRARNPQPWIDPVLMAAIDRDFWVEEMLAVQSELGIDGAIVVQAANSLDETRDLIEAVDGKAIRGVVGWVDLESDVLEQISEIGRDRRLVGIRHLAHLDRDPQWLIRASVSSGMHALAEAALPFELVVQPQQLGLALTAALRHPRLTFVLDHLGKPPIASGDMASWRVDIAELAKLPNVVAKLSGLTIEAQWASWSIEDLRPVTEFAFEIFGPDRIMFGSDWPLVDLTGGLRPWLSTALELVDDRNQPKVFGGNASRIYGLGPVDE